MCNIFNQQTTVNTPADLRAILTESREDGANSFWLSHEGKNYPHLALLVKGELATVTYFPKDRDAGYVPVGNLAGLPTGEMTAFSVSQYKADDVFVVNDAVLPVSLAVKIAEEFFHSDALPTGLKWLHL
ncbi:MAG: hypothetical protein ACJ8FY_22535 [Gemmataceae bacterium]